MQVADGGTGGRSGGMPILAAVNAASATAAEHHRDAQAAAERAVKQAQDNLLDAQRAANEARQQAQYARQLAEQAAERAAMRADAEHLRKQADLLAIRARAAELEAAKKAQLVKVREAEHKLATATRDDVRASTGPSAPTLAARSEVDAANNALSKFDTPALIVAHKEALATEVDQLRARLALLRKESNEAFRAALKAEEKMQAAVDAARAAKAQATRTKKPAGIEAQAKADKLLELEQARFNRKFDEWDLKQKDIALTEAKIAQKKEQMASADGLTASAATNQKVDALQADFDEVQRTLQTRVSVIDYMELDAKAEQAEAAAAALAATGPGPVVAVSPEQQARIKAAQDEATALRTQANGALDKANLAVTRWHRDGAKADLDAADKARQKADTAYQAALAGKNPKAIADAELARQLAQDLERVAQKKLALAEKNIEVTLADQKLMALQARAPSLFQSDFQFPGPLLPTIPATTKQPPPVTQAEISTARAQLEALRKEAAALEGEIQPMQTEAEKRATLIAGASKLEEATKLNAERVVKARDAVAKASTPADKEKAGKELGDALFEKHVLDRRKLAVDAVRAARAADVALIEAELKGATLPADQLTKAQALREDANGKIKDALDSMAQSDEGIALEKESEANRTALATEVAASKAAADAALARLQAAETRLRTLQQYAPAESAQLKEAQASYIAIKADYDKVLLAGKVPQAKQGEADALLAWREAQRTLGRTMEAGGDNSAVIDMVQRAGQLPTLDPTSPLGQLVFGTHDVLGNAKTASGQAQDYSEHVTRLREAYEQARKKVNDLTKTQGTQLSELDVMATAADRKTQADAAAKAANDRMLALQRFGAPLDLKIAQLQQGAADANKTAADAAVNWADANKRLMELEHRFVAGGGKLFEPPPEIMEARKAEAQLRELRDKTANDALVVGARNTLEVKRIELGQAQQAHTDWKKAHPYLPEKGSATIAALQAAQASLGQAERDLAAAANADAATEASNLAKQKLPMNMWVRPGQEPTSAQNEALYGLVANPQDDYAAMRVMSQPLINGDYANLGSGFATLQGRVHIYNVAGLALLGQDAASGLDGIGTPQALQNALRERNIFSRITWDQKRTLETVTSTIIDKGGENAQVRVLGFAYGTPELGMCKTALFEVKTEGGQTLYIDEYGRDYNLGEADNDDDNLNDFLSTNMLPAGTAVIAIPKNGMYTLDANGNVELHVGDGRTERWDQKFRRENHIDEMVTYTAVASGIALAVFSGGALAPVVVPVATTALMVSSGYGVAVSAESLIDQGRHGWEAERAALDGMNLLASALAVPGLGATGRALTLAARARSALKAGDNAAAQFAQDQATMLIARAALFNRPAGVIGSMAMVEGARQTMLNWSQMTPDEKWRQLMMFALNGVDMGASHAVSGVRKLLAGRTPGDGTGIAVPVHTPDPKPRDGPAAGAELDLPPPLLPVDGTTPPPQVTPPVPGPDVRRIVDFTDTLDLQGFAALGVEGTSAIEGGGMGDAAGVVGSAKRERRRERALDDPQLRESKSEPVPDRSTSRKSPLPADRRRPAADPTPTPGPRRVPVHETGESTSLGEGRPDVDALAEFSQKYDEVQRPAYAGPANVAEHDARGARVSSKEERLQTLYMLNAGSPDGHRNRLVPLRTRLKEWWTTDTKVLLGTPDYIGQRFVIAQHPESVLSGGEDARFELLAPDKIFSSFDDARNAAAATVFGDQRGWVVRLIAPKLELAHVARDGKFSNAQVDGLIAVRPNGSVHPASIANPRAAYAAKPNEDFLDPRTRLPAEKRIYTRREKAALTAAAGGYIVGTAAAAYYGVRIGLGYVANAAHAVTAAPGYAFMRDKFIATAYVPLAYRGLAAGWRQMIKNRLLQHLDPDHKNPLVMIKNIADPERRDAALFGLGELFDSWHASRRGMREQRTLARDALDTLRYWAPNDAQAKAVLTQLSYDAIVHQVTGTRGRLNRIPETLRHEYAAAYKTWARAHGEMKESQAARDAEKRLLEASAVLQGLRHTGVVRGSVRVVPFETRRTYRQAIDALAATEKPKLTREEALKILNGLPLDTQQRVTTGVRGAMRGITWQNRQANHLAFETLRVNPSDKGALAVLKDIPGQITDPQSPVGRGLFAARTLSFMDSNVVGSRLVLNPVLDPAAQQWTWPHNTVEGLKNWTSGAGSLFFQLGNGAGFGATVGKWMSSLVKARSSTGKDIHAAQEEHIKQWKTQTADATNPAASVAAASDAAAPVATPTEAASNATAPVDPPAKPRTPPASYRPTETRPPFWRTLAGLGNPAGISHDGKAADGGPMYKPSVLKRLPQWSSFGDSAGVALLMVTDSMTFLYYAQAGHWHLLPSQGAKIVADYGMFRGARKDMHDEFHTNRGMGGVVYRWAATNFFSAPLGTAKDDRYKVSDTVIRRGMPPLVQMGASAAMRLAAEIWSSWEKEEQGNPPPPDVFLRPLPTDVQAWLHRSLDTQPLPVAGTSESFAIPLDTPAKPQPVLQDAWALPQHAFDYVTVDDAVQDRSTLGKLAHAKARGEGSTYRQALDQLLQLNPQWDPGLIDSRFDGTRRDDPDYLINGERVRVGVKPGPVAQG